MGGRLGQTRAKNLWECWVAFPAGDEGIVVFHCNACRDLRGQKEFPEHRFLTRVFQV